MEIKDLRNIKLTISQENVLKQFRFENLLSHIQYIPLEQGFFAK